LIYVSYAYSGWNAATYFAGEIHDPQRIVPRALIYGTALVTLLYLLLNYVFLETVPLERLSGTVEVGALSAVALFGAEGGMLMSGMLSLLLLSTISALTLAGPRVLQVIGEDIPSLRPLAARTRNGAPLRAVLVQQGLALAFVATGSFEGVLSYAGFTLTLFALLTVLGVVVLRRNEPDLVRPYKTWGYPFTPLLFILVSSVTLVVVLWERPLAAAGGLITVLAGLMLARGRYRGVRRQAS
jgi:APA family basic amino acid/polyamine antiporter